MAKRSAKLPINEDIWTFTIYDDGKYESIVSDDVEECAETDPEHRRVAFKASKFSFATVVHEIFHVVFSYSGLPEDTLMKARDMEEQSAILVEKNLLKILSKSVIIYNKLASKEDRLDKTNARSIQRICQSLSALEEKKLSEKTRRHQS